MWRTEKGDGQGEGEGIIGEIKETPLVRNPILLNRYRKSSIKPPGGAYLFEAYLRGLIDRDRGGYLRGGVCLFNLEKTMVSVLHKELEYKVKKLKNKKVGGHSAEDQNQIRTSSW